MVRYNNNPILSPDPKSSWDSYAAFNGSVIHDGSDFHLLYRAMGQKQTINGKELQLSTIGYAKSTDGYKFSDRKQLIKPEHDWEKFGCEDPRITKIDDEYFVFYTALSDWPPYPQAIKIAVSIFKDFDGPMEKHLVTPFNSKAMVLFPQKINGKYVALLTPNTDMPPAKIGIAWFDKKEDMWSQLYWRDWYKNLSEHTLPLQRMSTDQIEVGAVPVLTEHGWLFIYAHIQNYYNENARIFGIEAVLLDRDNPQKIIARMEEPLLMPVEDYEHHGQIAHVVFPSGALIEGDKFRLYYGAADSYCCVAETPLKSIFSKMRTNAPVALKFERYPHNPILEPIKEHSWEAVGVLNPDCIYLNNEMHIVYRAFSDDNTSTMGYARSKDGFTIDERLDFPIYQPREPFEDKKHGKGNSGCEDPRIIKIDDRIYMLYTAFDTVGPPRVAMTSISVEDFLSKKWHWTLPVLISPPGVDDKDAAFFPEKVNGKYVVLHRIDKVICFDYVDDLHFDGKRKWLHVLDYISYREDSWDSIKIGICGRPIKSDEGWILLYHGINKVDRQYRVGALLLDLEDPATVLSRTEWPLFEPEEEYEKVGFVPNVVFPIGAEPIGDTLFVYYGGADEVVGVATIGFKKLVDYMVDLKENKYVI